MPRTNSTLKASYTSSNDLKKNNFLPRNRSYAESPSQEGRLVDAYISSEGPDFLLENLSNC